MNTENNVKTTHSYKPPRGFTLIELVIVVAIIAILASIAIPSYQDSVIQSRRNNAQWALTAFASAMERYFTLHNTYTGAATGGNDTGAPDIFPTEVPLSGNGTEKFYDLTIQKAKTTTYVLRATPKNAQAGDGYIELTSTGVRRWDENGDGDTGDTGEDNWKEG